MSAAADVCLAERGKPSFDLVDPRSRGRGEMRMKTRMASQPGIDRGGLVRTVVVHHQMHVQLGRHVGLDGAQELQEFTAAMTPMQFANDFAEIKSELVYGGIEAGD